MNTFSQKEFSNPETLSKSEFLEKIGELLRDPSTLFLAVEQSYRGYIEQTNGFDTDETQILQLFGPNEKDLIHQLHEFTIVQIQNRSAQLPELQKQENQFLSELRNSGATHERSNPEIDEATHHFSQKFVEHLIEVRSQYARNLVGLYALQEFLGYYLEQNPNTDLTQFLQQIITGNVSADIVREACMFANLSWLESKPWLNQELTHKLVVKQYTNYSTDNQQIDWRQIADAARVVLTQVTNKDITDLAEVDMKKVADLINKGEIEKKSPSNPVLTKLEVKLKDPDFLFRSAMTTDKAWKQSERERRAANNQEVPNYLNHPLFSEDELDLLTKDPTQLSPQDAEVFKEARKKFAQNTSGLYSLWVALQIFADRGDNLMEKLEEIANDSPNLDQRDKHLLCRFAHQSWLCDQPWLGRELSSKVDHFDNLSPEEQMKDWVQIQATARFYFSNLNQERSKE